jgi:hypothetical protein
MFATHLALDEISKWINFILDEQIRPLEVSEISKSDMFMLANLYAFLREIHLRKPNNIEDVLGAPRRILSYENYDIAEHLGHKLDLFVMVTVNMIGVIDHMTVTWTNHIHFDANKWIKNQTRKEHTKGR